MSSKNVLSRLELLELQQKELHQESRQPEDLVRLLAISFEYLQKKATNLKVETLCQRVGRLYEVAQR